MNRTLLLCFLALLASGAVFGAALWYRSPSPPQPNVTPFVKDYAKSTAEVKARPDPLVKLPSGIDIRFREVTKEAGIQFVHYDGRTEMEYIMDQTGSGLAWLDYDQDGLMDLFIVQGYTFVPPYPKTTPTCKLYKNLGKGKFRDVTDEVGLAHVGCGQGVAVGDIDNSGYPSLFLTCFGKPNVLYRNVPDGKGGRRFKDVTREANLFINPDWQERPNFSTSAAFLDYNNDGHLDLFVCSYVKIPPLSQYPECRSPKGKRGPVRPQFERTDCVLYRNNGDGTFTNVSKEAGIAHEVKGKALGVVALNLDADNGRNLTDIFVACDTVANFLFKNLGGGKFEPQGPGCGCLVSREGTPQAYMGVDADDLDGDGRPDLFVTAFQRETSTFFRNEGRFQFLDATSGTGLGPPCWNRLKFGTCFIDVDHDGSPDIVVTNGHVSRNVDDDGDPDETFKQQPQFFLNDGKGHFKDLSRQVGPYFLEKHVGRGLAYCDYDNDGHMDLAFNNSGEPAVLLHNESKTPYHWIRLELRGTKSNRDAVGAIVTVHVANKKIVRQRKGGGSYCSASDPRLLVGLGSAQKADKIEIHWPSGAKQEIGPLAADRGYRISEGSDKVEGRP